MPRTERHLFRREGEYWTIAYERAIIRLRDSAGLRYLAALVRRPGEAVHASELRGAADELEATRRRRKDGPTDAERDRLAVTKGLKSAIARIRATHPTLGGHFDATVRYGYHCRYLPDPRYPMRWLE